MNPNIAAHLIAEQAPVPSEERSVSACDGGHRELGHLRVYINLELDMRTYKCSERTGQPMDTDGSTTDSTDGLYK
uniref:Uncharacterized protein n=1 Tax=Globodera rostochiensis TaxID=31243 RepID=A0A914GV78_GLORO